MIKFPIEAFCLNGSYGDKIALTIDEVFDFPQRVSEEGGYDISATLEINAGCYSVKSSRYISATGAVYRFCDGLQKCCNTLHGSAEYRMKYETDLIFTVEMQKGGHARVLGEYRERPEKQTSLTFEFETDRSALTRVLESIEMLKEYFGGMEGINE